MRTLTLLSVLLACTAFAGPPPMTKVSFKKTADLLAAKGAKLTPAERDAKSLLELGAALGLDEVYVNVGYTEDKLTSAPAVIYTRVSWDMWATCNRLTDLQKKTVAALAPRLEPERKDVLGWAQLNTGKTDAGRDALVARFDELVKLAPGYSTLREANMVLTCVTPHLPAADAEKRRAALDKASAALPPMPPG
jgi:hypothetical protein